MGAPAMQIDDGTLALFERLLKPLEDGLQRQERTLEKVLEQVKLTNGRVNDHDDRLEEIENTGKAQTERRVRRSDRWHTRIGWAVGGACVLLGGAEGERLLRLLFN